VASGGPNSIKTSGYTITVADILGGNKFLYNSASPGTFTLPTSSLVDGMVVNVAQIGAGALTVSGGTISGTTVTTAQYQGLSFVYVASGTTWYSVAPAATSPGLVLLNATSIANSGGSATKSTGGTVTFTGVNSVSLNGVFGSSYENYRLIIRATTSTAGDGDLRLRVSGTDATTNYSKQTWASYSGASTLGYQETSQSIARIVTIDTSSGGWAAYDIYRPSLAVATAFVGMTGKSSANAVAINLNTLNHSTATAYDGFTILPTVATGGTITGTVAVYGYAQ
jgi:hypothetical protein